MARYVFKRNYAQPKEDGTLENWEESVDRIYRTHDLQLIKKGIKSDILKDYLKQAEIAEKQKRFLSSQRARQFAEPHFEKGILKNNLAIYNCSFSLLDRVDFFKEIMYLAISGVGTGYSIRKEFVDKLPEIKPLTRINTIYTIEDSKEGWANAVDVLMHSIFYSGLLPEFDFNAIRPQGALIAGKWLAPGPEPLKKAFNKVIEIAVKFEGRQLTPFYAHLIACILVDSVVTAGVRRAACIALFDRDDNSMLNCKRGSFYLKHPELARANNSVCVAYGEDFSLDELTEIFKRIKAYGEPGILRVPNYEYGYNPCSEILIHAVYHNEDGSKETGWGFCNLCEINAVKATTEEEFLEVCRLATITATVQSTYTDFKILSPVSKKIAERDSAVGISITGLYQNPLLQGKLLSKGAEVVTETNRIVAQMLGIPPCKRCTTIKPSGNASTILGLAGAGVHPIHSNKYLRRVDITKFSNEYRILKETPLIRETDDNSGRVLMSFPVEVESKLPTKETIRAAEHLKYIGMIKHFWVNKGLNDVDGTNYPNNVSATVEIGDNELETVIATMFINSHLFSGCSFLNKYSNHKYLPYTRLDTEELVEEYESIKKWLSENEVDVDALLTGVGPKAASDMAAIACAGGSCEII